MVKLTLAELLNGEPASVPRESIARFAKVAGQEFERVFGPYPVGVAPDGAVVFAEISAPDDRGFYIEGGWYAVHDLERLLREDAGLLAAMKRAVYAVETAPAKDAEE